uniref:Uncharacterized protein n=1 Tax=Lactuca sativa TaxID=4236 RepID=A0A9R1VCP3_LACSA|nr:hypothetical protein LSAT_V11C500287350 [Lactuca sativa]
MQMILIFRVVLDLKRKQRENVSYEEREKRCCYKRISFIEEQMFTRFIVGVIQGLSREHKDCVRAMEIGSLLRMKMTDVRLKIFYYVLDHFNFETLKVEFENYEVSVDRKFVHEMLGLPSGGSLLSNMDYIFENNEECCILKQVKNELLRSSAADDNFRINFFWFFLLIHSMSLQACGNVI